MRTLLRNRDACLACVEGSPAAVAVHDKPQWLSLFADCAVVEDPVGSKPQINLREGRDDCGPLGRFYETFIAANQITFHVDHDVVCTGAVVRDLDIEIAMSDKVRVRVPMHLLYELTSENGEIRIRRLAAHWELGPMLRQQMQFGLASAVVGVHAFWRMLKNLGLSGIQGFALARNTVGEEGKERVRRFIAALNNDHKRKLETLFADDGIIEWPYGHDRLAREWDLPKGEFRLGKLISAGRVTTATVYHRVDGREQRGVALFQFDRDQLLLRRVQWFMET